MSQEIDLLKLVNPGCVLLWDGTNWYVLRGDSSGNLKVIWDIISAWTGKVTPSNVQSPVSPLVYDGTELYQIFGDDDGHQYVQQRPGDGWEDSVQEVLSHELPDDGVEYLFTTQVPTNEIHVIETFCWRVVGAGFSSANVQISTAAGGIVCSSEVNPVNSQWYFWNGRIHLKPTQSLVLGTWGGVTGQTIQIRIFGYKMYIDNP